MTPASHSQLCSIFEVTFTPDSSYPFPTPVMVIPLVQSCIFSGLTLSDPSDLFTISPTLNLLHMGHHSRLSHNENSPEFLS